jgi:hypothetical protein
MPPVLMEAARPLIGLLCDRIGTRLRRFLPAAPAMLALRTRTLNPNSRLLQKFPHARLGPNGPLLSSASTRRA